MTEVLSVSLALQSIETFIFWIGVTFILFGVFLSVGLLWIIFKHLFREQKSIQQPIEINNKRLP